MSAPIAAVEPVLKRAKHLELPTVARVPETYAYLMKKQIERMPKERVELMEEIAEKERAVMMGSPDEANFLCWLCELMGARRVLEVGVFRGSTTLALALALPPDGKVVGLDICAEFLEGTGRKYWQKELPWRACPAPHSAASLQEHLTEHARRLPHTTTRCASWHQLRSGHDSARWGRSRRLRLQAGVEHKIDFRVGPAVGSMDKLLEEGMTGQFDMCFIDADKANYDNYYERALKLVRKGGVIAVDNVLWSGRHLKPESSQDADSIAIARINEKLAKDDRVSVNMLSIADGVTLCRVK